MTGCDFCGLLPVTRLVDSCLAGIGMNSAKSSPAASPEPLTAEDLPRRYGAVLVRYFLRRGFNAADAQDFTQEVFLRLSRPDLLPAVQSADAYLFAVAGNLVTEHHRQRAVRRAYALDRVRSDVDRCDPLSPDRVLGGREELDLVVTTLNEMPERMRNIFILARLEDMPRSEIAVRMGVSKRTVEGDIMAATAWLAERRRRLT